MKCGTAMPVGQAVVQGASWQYRQRSASTTACAAVSGGVASAKWRASSAGLSRAERMSGAVDSGTRGGWTDTRRTLQQGRAASGPESPEI
jgi:hypothetical protein